jgi:hypothetical protein
MFVQIHDIIVKQVETKDISVNVNPSLCTCNMYFQKTVVEWEPRYLIRFSYKICKTAKLLISAGMGPVSPGLFVKLLQKIFMSHKFVKRSFHGSFLKYELQQVKGPKMQLFYTIFREKYPRGFFVTFCTHCLSSCVANY